MTDTPRGGIDLRIDPNGRRRFMIVGALAIAIAVSGSALRALVTDRALPVVGGSPITGLIAGGLFALFALWCAFVDEVWHVERNCIEHRIGIRAWRWIRCYRDAQLEIVRRVYYPRASPYPRPYYRLYAVSGGVQHFLLERDIAELKALADIFGEHTGWPFRQSG